MKSECSKYVTDIIGLKRPTGLDKLTESIPKPKGAIPNFGLPRWKVMPLESKIPMVPGPEGAYNFTRRKLGKELWIPAPDGDFNLNDPYCYEMELTYDSLHDKHLVPYFSRPNNIRHLLKAGLITKSLDAKCSLRDYNMYRKYLRKIHSDGIKKELNRSSKWSTEEAAIMYAEEQAQNEVRRLKRRERLMKIRGASIRKRKQAEKLKARQQKEKERKTEERLQALMLKKQEDINLQRLKRSERADLLRQKQKAAADRERKKLIDVLIEWTKKERIRTKTRNTRMNQEREERRMKVERKWEERQEFQKKQMEKEQFLLQCIENQRERFIGEYNYKVEKETKRMQKLLSDVKMFMKCYFARHQGGAERICCLKDSDFDMNQSVKSPTTPDGSSHAQKQDKKELRYLDKKLASKHKEGWKKKKDADLKETSSYSEASKVGSKAKAKKKAKRKIKKQIAKGMKKKTIKTHKGGKKKKRGKKQKKQKKEIDEKEKDESDTTRESESTTKTNTSRTTTTSTPSEKCRCQIIKNDMNVIST